MISLNFRVRRDTQPHQPQGPSTGGSPDPATSNPSGGVSVDPQVAPRLTRVMLEERRRIARAADQARFDAMGLPDTRLKVAAS